ncbi:MAG: ABC transporter permease [Methylotenera sp. 24-45-7]|jgi:cell division transport system permease protein|nr:MAG: ABC transporter permease [Mehylophilales bacterium 35-46-6]OYZ41841.1 MAG: ABC transporter permease [Methylotenera sp. 24-45-7]OZA09758.1 MAG: ABC transporter permease [Methylotenera sp. 17-45-7]OZA54252.1 MAG: ABC transporter permease [Methylophilales bacterium 39-45-7]HQS37121.1 permease-like cell division protein FtsX [Methylotenera sp.]
MSHWLNHHLQAIKLVLSRMRSNALSSFIICLVISVALCLPSLFYLGVDNLSKLSQHMQNETEISLFLKLDTSSETIAQIDSALSQNPDILEYHFVSKDQAWQQLQLKSKDNADISNAVNHLASNPLPDAFFIQAKSAQPEQLEALRSSLQNIEGVGQALLNAEWAKRLATLLSIGKQFVFFVALLLAVVLLVMIGNTVRMQILTQKDEIEVSYLIGATNSFIKIPFLYAGALYGLFGGILSSIMITAMIMTFNQSIAEISHLYSSDFSLRVLNLQLYVSVTAIAIIIGWIGAYLSVSRALSVIRIK